MHNVNIAACSRPAPVRRFTRTPRRDAAIARARGGEDRRSARRPVLSPVFRRAATACVVWIFFARRRRFPLSTCRNVVLSRVLRVRVVRLRVTRSFVFARPERELQSLDRRSTRRLQLLYFFFFFSISLLSSISAADPAHERSTDDPRMIHG